MCIRDSDRLDALSIAVNYWVEQMAQDANRNIVDRKEQLLKQELDRFADAYYGVKQSSSMRMI